MGVAFVLRVRIAAPSLTLAYYSIELVDFNVIPNRPR